MQSFKNYYEDFVVGEKIQHATTKTIMESDNNLFTLLTMNHHPVHLNTQFCESHPHGQILVVGTLVFSVVVGFTVPDISWNAIANLGYENVDHNGPVFIGDTLRAETEILSKRESKSKPDRGIVYVETKGYNQRDELILTLRRKIIIPKRGEA